MEPEAKPCILVVDDYPLILELMEHCLGAQGFRVLTARSGAEALGLVATESVDLVVLDVMMPEMDGFETLRRLRGNVDGREIPVLFLTARKEVQARVKGIEMGAVDYLVKPVDQRELLTRIRSVLRRQELFRSQTDGERLQAVKEVVLTVQHGVNNPLQSVTTACEMLLRRAREAQDERSIGYARAALDNARAIGDLLARLGSITGVESVQAIGDQRMLDLERSAPPRDRDEDA